MNNESTMTQFSYALGVALLLLLGVVGVWDLSVKYSGHPESTVSSIIRVWSRDWPLIPFGVGLLIGHLFFQ